MTDGDIHWLPHVVRLASSYRGLSRAEALERAIERLSRKSNHDCGITVLRHNGKGQDHEQD